MVKVKLWCESSTRSFYVGIASHTKFLSWFGYVRLGLVWLASLSGTHTEICTFTLNYHRCDSILLYAYLPFCNTS